MMDNTEIKILNLYADDYCKNKPISTFNTEVNKRTKSINQIFSEILYCYKKYKISKFEFIKPMDFDSEQLKKFCKLIIKHKLRIEWNANIAAVFDFNENCFSSMKSAGCHSIVYNLIYPLVSLISKPKSDSAVSDISAALKFSNSLGMKNIVNLIPECPSGSKIDFQETAKFLTENDKTIDGIRLTFCPFYYLSSLLFRTKIGFCENYDICSTCLKGSEEIYPLSLFSQIKNIEELNKPVIYSSSISISREIISANILPYLVTSSTGLSLFADYRKRQLLLFHGNKELTKNKGLHCAFLSNNKWFDTSIADWQVEKFENKLVIRIFFAKFEIKQEWKLFFEDNTLRWDIEANFESDDIIGEVKFGLFLNSDYKEYFSNYVQGNFPVDFNQWRDLELSSNPVRVFGLKEENNLPKIYFALGENKEKFLPIIQNSDKDFCCRAIQVRLPKEYAGNNSFKTSLYIRISDSLPEVIASA